MKKGFTLVELMVVVGILSIIMLTISQPIASIIKYQRESQIPDNMRDNLQFVINKMEKELKTSSNVYVNDAGELKFKDQEGGFVTYKLEGNTIKRNNVDFTDNTIFNVEKLNFIVTDKPNLSKLVTVSIDAKSLDDKDSVIMQTSINPVNDKPVITDGLTVYLDAGNRNSYSGTGNLWLDLSGNNNNLTLSGNPSSSRNNSGYIQFDGNDDFAIRGNISGLSTGNTPHSMEIWVNFDQLSFPPNNARWWLLNLGGYGNGSHHWIGQDANNTQFGIWNGTQLKPLLNQSRWLYIASTYDNTNRSYSLYIKNKDGNGSSENYSVVVPNSGQKFDLPLNPLHIGKKWDRVPINGVAPETNFKGKISNFRLYNRALLPEEVEYNYNVTKGRFDIN